MDAAFGRKAAAMWILALPAAVQAQTAVSAAPATDTAREQPQDAPAGRSIAKSEQHADTKPRTGSVDIRVCVDEKGHLTVIRSSGSARLDEGAIKLAKAGEGHYHPPPPGAPPCFAFRITFALND